MRYACLLISALVVVLAGCGGGSDSTKPGPILVSYTRTGGVAGMTQTLTVRSSGQSVTATGIEGSPASHFTLTSEDLDRLQRNLNAAHLDTVGSAPPSGCADCYIYAVTYKGATTRRDETNLPRSMKPLVAQMQAIIDAHD